MFASNLSDWLGAATGRAKRARFGTLQAIQAANPYERYLRVLYYLWHTAALGRRGARCIEHHAGIVVGVSRLNCCRACQISARLHGLSPAPEPYLTGSGNIFFASHGIMVDHLFRTRGI